MSVRLSIRGPLALALIFVLGGCGETFRFYAIGVPDPVSYLEIKEAQFPGRIRAQAHFVLDNSGSMTEELAQYVNQRFGSFLDGLRSRSAIRFEFAFNTTSFVADAGALIAGSQGETIVTENSRAALLDEILATFRNRLNEPNSGYEQGLAAAAAAVSNRGGDLFPPPGAEEALNRRVVIISDADDGSANSVASYAASLTGVESLRLHAIVAIPNNPCSSPSHESFGVRYQQAVSIVGGELKSICQPDFEQSLNGIFDSLQNFCVDLDRPPPLDTLVEVFVNGVPNSQFSIQGRQVCVELPLQPATVRVRVSRD